MRFRKRTLATAFVVASLVVVPAAEANTILGPNNGIQLNAAYAPQNVSGPINDPDLNIDILIGANFWQSRGYTLCSGVVFRFSDNPTTTAAPLGIWALSQRSTCQVFIDRDYWWWYKVGILDPPAGMHPTWWQWSMCNTVTHEIGHLAGLLHPATEAQRQTWVMGYGDNVGANPRATDCMRWNVGNASPPLGN